MRREVWASQTGQTLVFRYTVPASGIFGGSVAIAVPAGWTAPTALNAAGCVSSTAGTVLAVGQTITVSALTLAAGSTVDITYGATSGRRRSRRHGDGRVDRRRSDLAGAGAVDDRRRPREPRRLAEHHGERRRRHRGDGALDRQRSDDHRGVGKPTGKLVFTYTVPAGGVDTATVKLTVPPAGPRRRRPPTTRPATPPRRPAPSARPPATTVTGVTLAAGGTLTITYGDTSISPSGAATVTSTTGGPTTWTLQEASSQYGTLTTVAGGKTPAVTVFATDGWAPSPRARHRHPPVRRANRLRSRSRRHPAAPPAPKWTSPCRPAGRRRRSRMPPAASRPPQAASPSAAPRSSGRASRSRRPALRR